MSLALRSREHGEHYRSIHVSPGDNHLEIRLDPVPRYSFAGAARFPDGEPARNLPIGAVSLETSDHLFAVTDSSGAFRFDSLLVGSYRIGAQDERPPRPARLRVLKGRELKLEEDVMSWEIVVERPEPPP